MVDYSKWDNIDVSDDDEDDTGPALYRVNEGESFTVPGRNVTISPMPKEERKPQKQPALEGSSSSSSALVRQSVSPAALKAKMTRNGGETADYLWSQDVDSISLAFKVPPSTAAKTVRVSIQGTDCLQIHISDTLFFEGHVPTPLDDTFILEDVDWELKDMFFDGGSCRRLLVELRKKQMSGIVTWWRSAFKGHPEISEEQLVDRSAKQQSNSRSFFSALQEAQEMFREKVKDIKPTEIDISE